MATTATHFVYDFDEPSRGGRELLGGKGIGLAEMTALGVPVPAGFTISTDACRAYMANGKQVPDGLDDEVDKHIEHLEERAGKRFGDHDEPLLVSVRSGAAIYAGAVARPVPAEAREQLRRAYRAVFDSWDAPRAQVYRRTYDIPDDLGTAVNVVQMVFGNKGEGSGTGVCFTRDPSTGEPR